MSLPPTLGLRTLPLTHLCLDGRVDGAQRPMTTTLLVVIVMPLFFFFFFFLSFITCVCVMKKYSLVLLVSECHKNDNVS